MKIQTPPILRGMEAIDSCTREDQFKTAVRYTNLAFRQAGQNLSEPVRYVFENMVRSKVTTTLRRLRAKDWQREDREANTA